MYVGIAFIYYIALNYLGSYRYKAYQVEGYAILPSQSSTKVVGSL